MIYHATKKLVSFEAIPVPHEAVDQGHHFFVQILRGKQLVKGNLPFSYGNFLFRGSAEVFLCKYLGYPITRKLTNAGGVELYWSGIIPEPATPPDAFLMKIEYKL